MTRGPRLSLLVLVCAIELVDLSLLTALVPLLPGYADRFGFGASISGIVVAAFAVGNVLAALPAAALCGRLGTKHVTLAGLLLAAAGCVWLGLAETTTGLIGARLVQGAASATAWGAGVAWLVAETPTERRGRTLGITGAAAVAGMLAGPALGALAAEQGAVEVFVAYSAVVVLFALVAATQPAPVVTRQSWRALLAAARRPEIVFGFLVIFLAGAFLAAQSTIGPLALDALGWSAAGIGAVYMAGAVLEASGNPLLGHWLDRAGPARPTRAALISGAGLAASLALPWLERYWVYAVLVALSSAAFGFFFLPGLTSLSHGADAACLDYAYGISLASLSWAPGQMVGSLLAGGVAEAAGDSAAYAILAAATLLTVLALPRLVPTPDRGNGIADGHATR